MALTKLEQETIILFNEAEKTAEICTHNGRLKTRLKELARQRPEEVRLKCEDQGSVSYTIPKKWIKLTPTRIMTEKQKAASEKALERAHKVKRAPAPGGNSNENSEVV